MSVGKVGEGIEGEGPGRADAQGVEKGAHAGREGPRPGVPEDTARVDRGLRRRVHCPDGRADHAGQLRIEELGLMMRPVPELAQGDMPVSEEGLNPQVEQAARAGGGRVRRRGGTPYRDQTGPEHHTGVSHEGADHQLKLRPLGCVCRPTQLRKGGPDGGHDVRVVEEFSHRKKCRGGCRRSQVGNEGRRRVRAPGGESEVDNE